jgi:hypothetical protein
MKITGFKEINILFLLSIIFISLKNKYKLKIKLKKINKKKLKLENRVFIYLNRKNQKPILPKISKNCFVLITFSIILIGILLRLYKIRNLGLDFDEGTGWLAVEKIMELGYPKINDKTYYLRGIPYHYLVAFISFLGGGLNELNLRLLSIISYTLLSVFLIKIFKLINKKDLSLIILIIFFLAFSPWDFIMSTWGRMYYFAYTMGIITLYFFLKFIKSNKNIDYLFLLLFSVISVLTHNSGYVVFLFPAIYLLINRKEYFKSFKKNKNIIIKLVTLILISLLTLAINVIINKFSSADISTGSTDRNIYQDLIRSLHINLFRPDNFAFLIQQFNLLIFPLILSIFFINKMQLNDKFIIIITSTLFFLFSIYEEKIYGGRIIFFLIGYLIMSSYILKKYIRNNILDIFLILVFLITPIINKYNAFKIFNINYGEKIPEKINTSHVIDFVADNKTPELFVKDIINNEDKVIFFGYPLRSYPYIKDYKNQIVAVSKMKEKEINFPYDHYLENQKIYSYEEIESIINEINGKIYVITTFSVLSQNKDYPYLYHFDKNIFNNLKDNYKLEKIYTGLDNISSVYIINQN